MTFNTGNPIGSTDARDLSDNAENFDVALGTLSQTWVDRLGVTRDSFEGRLAKGSFYRVGDFVTGYTLTNMRQTLEYSGHEYSWAGTFPKVVAAGATPATSGGIGAGAWVDRTDVALRGELLAGPLRGALFGYELKDMISFREFIDPSDTNADAAFQRLAEFINTSPLWVDGFGSAPTAVVFPSGTYEISQDVTINRGVWFKGLGGANIVFNGDCGIKISPSLDVTSIFDDMAYTHKSGSASSIKPLLLVERNFRGRYQGNRFLGKQVRGGRRYGLYSGKTAMWACQYIGNHFGYCDCGLRSGNSADHTHCLYAGNTIANNYVVGAIICNPKNGEFISNSVEWNTGRTGLAITGRTNGASHEASGFTIESNYILNNGSDHSGDASCRGLIAGYGIPDTEGWDTASVTISSSSFYHGLVIKSNHVGSTYTGYGIDVNTFTGCEIAYNEPVGSLADIRIAGLDGPSISRNRNPISGSINVLDTTTNGAGLMQEIYLDSTAGLDTNSGAAGSPVKTLATALGRLAQGGTINLVTSLTIYSASISKSIQISVPSGVSLSVFNVTIPKGISLDVSGAGSIVNIGWRGFVLSANASVQIRDGMSINSTSTDTNSALFYMSGCCDVDVGDLTGYTTAVTATYLARSVDGGRNHVGFARQSTITTANVKFLADGSKMLVESVPSDIVLSALNGGSAVRV